MGPPLIVCLELFLLAGFGRGDQVNSNQDMLLQEIGESIASRLPIVGDDGIAEMLLVLQQQVPASLLTLQHMSM